MIGDIFILILLVVIGIMHVIVWRYMMYYKKQTEELMTSIYGDEASAPEYITAFYLDSKNEKLDELRNGFIETTNIFIEVYGEPICAASNISTVYSWDEGKIKLGIFIKEDECELPYVDSEVYFIDSKLDAVDVGNMLKQTQGQEKRIYFFGDEQ